METYRIANFVVQSAYLVGHLAFIVWFLRRSQPTPVWRWFTVLNVTFWLWVAGRFMETVVYLFFPGNNGLYVFAANFQYIGDTGAAVSFAIWNLYLAGHGKLASNRLFRALMLAVPLVICVLVFTNESHQLIYTKLDMGQRVTHGPLFVPCVVVALLIMLAGYLVAVVHIVKTGRDKAKRLMVFSLLPAAPIIASLVRSVSGVDQFDYTALVLAVSAYCLYLIVFKRNYAKIVPSSIEAVLDQTAHPIYLYDPASGEFAYSNRIAREAYVQAARGFAPLLDAGGGRVEGTFDGRALQIDATPLPGESRLVVTAIDLTEIVQQQRQLEDQIAELERLSASLGEQNRNIDAYLGSLYQVEGVERKRELISRTYGEIDRAIDAIRANLAAAKEGSPRAREALRENLGLAQDCIARIRLAVAQLKEA